MTRCRPIIIAAIVAGLSSAACRAQFPPATPPAAGAAAGPAASAPALPPPAGTRPFQPGIHVDWEKHVVYVDALVAQRDVPLEFLACFAGREHESVLRLRPSAAHVYVALGLVGLTPGSPPQWRDDGSVAAPTGDLVDIAVEYEHGGAIRRESAWNWLREIEYDRTPLPRPFVFCGSRRRANGSLAADASGSGVALVDFDDSLLCTSRRHSELSAELWVSANPARVPPQGTAVRMVFSPAVAETDPQIRIDFRGDATWNGRYVSPSDLCDLLSLWVKRRGSASAAPSSGAGSASIPSVRIVLADALATDARRWRRQLEQAGIPADAFAFVRERSARAAPPGSSSAPATRDALGAP